ncbi:YhgE/Pip family protein, partial [Staphylococcus carnosus]
VNDAQNRNQEVNNRLQDNLQTSPQSTSKTSENNIKFSLMSTDGNSNKTSFDSEDANAMDSSLSKALLSLTQYTDQQTESTQEGIGTLEDIAYGILSSDKPEEFEPVLDNMNSRLEATSKSNQQFIDILSEIEDREDVDLSTEINKLEEANNSVNNLIRKQNLLSDALSKGSTGKAEAVDLLKTLPQVDRDLKGLRNYIQTELNQSLLNVSNQVTSVLNNGDTKLSTVQSKLNTISQVIDEGEAILKDGQNRIETIQNALPLVEQRYMDAMAVAQRYYPEFEQEVNNAASFVRNDLPDIEQRLADTTATVNENIPTIFNRYDRLVGLLDENQPEAKQKLHDLAEFIRNDLPGVEKDLAKADKLFDEIEDDDAVDKMVDLLKNDLKKQADVVANPIKINQEDIFPVKDYGSASTPFYTALACWVGALLMVSLLTTDNKHKELASYLTKREEYLGKSGLFYLIGIVQALIVSIGDIVILHAQVEHVGWFIGLTVLISIVFVTIVYTLVSLLGNPGKALAIILLVLQIAGGGGTFPIEVTPEFFQIIHPFIPFSYAVDALREAVGGYVPEILTRKVITLSLFGIIFLLIGIIFKPITDPIMRKVAERAEKSDVME